MPTPRRILRSLLFPVLITCAGRPPHSDGSALLPAPSQATDSCPSLTDSTAATVASDVVIDGRERPVPGTRYVSVLIDGQRAAWNELSYRWGTDGPDLNPDDIDTVEVVKPHVAQSAYGTCPGVGLILITTKSKKWHPYSHQVRIPRRSRACLTSA